MTMIVGDMSTNEIVRMTGPEAQSVVWFVTTEPYLLGLGFGLGVAAAAAVAGGTWVVTVVLAELMRRAGRRGPAEVLLRRLTYGRSPSAVTT